MTLIANGVNHGDVKTAYIHLREDPHYRSDAFATGCKRLGYDVVMGQPARTLDRDDLLIIWNKTNRSSRAIDFARPNRTPVIVCENGYYGRDPAGRQTFAMALDGHNGSGRWHWPEGDTRRLDALQVDFKPIRKLDGEKVLIAGQRGFGSPLMRSPPDFGAWMMRDLTLNGYRPRLREHPGRHQPKITITEDLEGCRCLVVWSSNSATAAMVDGYSVFHRAPTMVTAGAARVYSKTLDKPLDERMRQERFARMAWAQWFLAEIEEGLPIEVLLEVHAGRLAPTSPGFGL